jgi:hypothetical protein
LRYGGDDGDIRDCAERCRVLWPDGRCVTPEPSIDWWDDNNGGFDSDGDTSALTECPVVMRRVGKKTAGRLLDGREWNEMPRVGSGPAGLIPAHQSADLRRLPGST